MDEEFDGQIEDLLGRMTLEEKVAMAAGSDLWHSTGVPRLGIPSIKVSDGPNGARGGGAPGSVEGPTSACFPVGISLASTWNTDLVQEIGVALGEEAQSKSANILLAPTVNIHRSPLNGRNFECFSEDPHLSARMAVAYITGVQSTGVGACVKHFAANDSEFQRQTINSQVGERALREIYLPPFEAAVKEAKTWSVMSAYNKLNGAWCSENARLLTHILRDEWGFQGIVMSDWFGTNSTAPVANAGLDLEMPGPARFMGDQLLAAVQRGDVSETVIDAKVRRLLALVFKSGVIERPERPEENIDRPEHRRLIRRAAAEGIVLLKNAGDLLPLDAAALNKVAVIGPNAAFASMMGGGSAQVNAHYAVTPLDGLRTRCGASVELVYAEGCPNHRALPGLPVEWLTPTEDAGEHGFKAEYFNTFDFSGEVVHTSTVQEARFIWFGDMPAHVNPAEYSLRLSAVLTPPADGDVTFALTSAGLSRLLIDGQVVVDNWTAQRMGGSYFGMGSYEETADIALVGGQHYDLVIEYSRQGGSMLGGLQVGGLPVQVEDPIAQAEQLAAQADVALLFVGTNGEWESEGFDRPNMDLPSRQDELIARVVAANPRTVVVLNTGSPVTMPWLDQVPAVLEAWFPGQECGNAIADVLFGDVDACGRLPQTFPVRLEDNPAFINYPGENGAVHYGEGLFVGYRYYDKKRIDPLFPFGFGLSYTTFAYRDLRLSALEYQLGQSIDLLVDVTNTGARPGQEVVQVYVHDVEATLARPEKELNAFAKVALDPGETKTVHLTLEPRALAFYDDARARWVTEAGAFQVLVGSSAQAIHVVADFTLQVPDNIDAGQFDGPANLSKASTLREVLDHAQGRSILAAHLGHLVDAPEAEMAMGFSLEMIAQFAPDMVTAETLAEIDAALRALD